MDSFALALVDVARIKDYIIATRGLAQMRGASSLLDKANTVGTVDSLTPGRGNAESANGGIRIDPTTGIESGSDWELVFAGGGLAQVVFRHRHEAEEFELAVRDHYRRITSGARAVTAVVDLADLESGYGESVRKAAAILARRKAALDAAAPPIEMIGGTFVKTCEECGVRPAEVRGSVRHALRDVRSACKAKEDRGRELRSAGLALDRATRDALRTRLGTEVEIPAEIDDLARGSHPEGYLAYIEADGDGMGDHLAKLSSKHDYARFSHALNEAMGQAWIESVEEHVISVPETGVLPATILIAGGDDLLALCSPRYALSLVDSFCRNLPRCFEGALGAGADEFPVSPQSISASVGVLVAHHTFPFSEMQRLGKSLQSSAKRLSRRKRAEGEAGWVGAVDFQLTTAAALPSIERYRQSSMKVGTRQLHARPYPAGPAGLTQLIKRAGELAKARAARSKLRAFDSILRRDRDAATRDFQIALGRMKDGRQVIDAWLTDNGSRDWNPWIRSPEAEGDGELTPVLDLIETAELVG